MWVKLVLAILLFLMIAGAIYFAQPHQSAESNSSANDSASLRLLTWNIGYAELEDDTRAHDKDLPAVAEVILREDPDAVALQELTGSVQLNNLLRLLHGKYRGAVAQQGRDDRFEAVLVKDGGARFTPVAAGARFAIAATFRPRQGAREAVLLSAHADAFNAARRRRYTEAIVDWAQDRTRESEVFIAGDFNFELKAANETNLYTDNVKHDSESYSHILRSFRDLGRDAGDTAINDRRIDYVFGRTNLQQVGRVAVLRDAAVGRMDHWPLLVEVKP
ncbi:MAG TPA: endonuclease/exonuclease/phosphatase family protein [Pyrinomonadaceae bacterium]|nr:endonuclease/exonuclease/phosphatase family protein [Pyrinomonadaceae bacterium]